MTGLGVGVGLPFRCRQPSSSGDILDQLFTSSNGAWWVAANREGDGSLTDGTGGGRHMLLPGGTADPVLLDHTGTDYFWLPGTSGNELTFDPGTGVISGDQRYRLAVWQTGSNPASRVYFAGRAADVGINQETNGNFRILVYDSGSNARGYSTNGSITLQEGWLCLEIDLDVDNGSSASEVTFSYKWVSDGGDVDAAIESDSGWTLAETTATGHPVISVRGTIATYDVGSGLNTFEENRVAAFYVRDGIGGSGTVQGFVKASDADPNSTTFTEASSNAATVTINRSSTGYKTAVVDQPLYVGATDDYLEASDVGGFFGVAADEDMTAVVVYRAHHSLGTARLFASLDFNPDSGGFELRGNSTVAYSTAIGTAIAAVSDIYAGITFDSALHHLAGVLDRDTDEWEAFYDGVGTGSPGDASGIGASGGADSELRLFADGEGTPGNFADAEIVGAAWIKDTALTAAEISDVADALITRNGGTP